METVVIIRTSGTVTAPESVKVRGLSKSFQSIHDSLPNLWSKVEIIDDGWCGSDRLEEFLARVEKVLGLSDPTEIDITVSEQREFTVQTTSWDSGLNKGLVGVLRQHHNHRIKSFTFNMDEENSWDATGFHLVTDQMMWFPNVKSLTILNLGYYGQPWLMLLWSIFSNGVSNGLADSKITSLRLSCVPDHRDGLLNHACFQSCRSSTLTDIDAHVAPRVAVRFMATCPVLARASWTFSNSWLPPLGFWATGSVVNHQQLLHLAIKSVPRGGHRHPWGNSFPHAIFSCILHHLRCPNLQSFTVGVDPSQKIGPMGENAPFISEGWDEEQLGLREWFEDDDDSLHVRSNYFMDWYRRSGDAGDAVKQSSYIRSVAFKNGQKNHNETIVSDPFLPHFLDNFLDHSPSLKSLELICIPFHPHHIINVLSRCPRLETLKMREVQVPKGRFQGEYPEPLASGDLLNWLKDAGHLPNLRYLDWRLTRFPKRSGALEDLLNTLYNGGRGSLKEAHLWVGRNKDKAVVGGFDRKQLEDLRKGGLVLKVRSCEIYESG
ncbi:hypothetical protein AAF712_015246 [Marasmius tenuissimus]|uniref:Uncharacterized protein n=1 Tax=Marasmius tenuissimus TaxID=585030 RepID=A0ABR2Z8U8_9AGAR